MQKWFLRNGSIPLRVYAKMVFTLCNYNISEYHETKYELITPRLIISHFLIKGSLLMSLGTIITFLLPITNLICTQIAQFRSKERVYSIPLIVFTYIKVTKIKYIMKFWYILYLYALLPSLSWPILSLYWQDLY